MADRGYSLLGGQLTSPVKKRRVLVSTKELFEKARTTKRLLSGWRMGVCVSASTALAAFLLNLAFTIWASVRFGHHNGIGTLTEDCNAAPVWSRWLHVAINILSSILVSCSNYCMQQLSAPTRGEVDQAHSKNHWIDIGVPSVYNLRFISWRRIILWCLLGLSSLPLHLLYVLGTQISIDCILDAS